MAAPHNTGQDLPTTAHSRTEHRSASTSSNSFTTGHLLHHRPCTSPLLLPPPPPAAAEDDDKMGYSTRMSSSWEALLPPHWKRSVRAWLEEDVPSFDIGGFVVGEKETVAHLYGKSPGVLCGVPFFNAVFDELGCSVEWQLSEGATITPGPEGKQLVAVVKGKVRHILLGERTALNIVTRASGIATEAREVSDVVKAAGWQGSVAGTRKTTPGFRLVEKYALLVGGVSTHRYDLSSMVMLKDNHVWSAGGAITQAVHKARSAAGFSTKIEVECRSIEEAFEAASAGAEVVMLDNFDPEGLKAAAAVIKEKHPYITIEASGGITKETIASYTGPSVDVISLGYLTQGYKCLDLSLKVQKTTTNEGK